MYLPTSSLSDPPAESPIAKGVIWVQDAALGSAATTVAVVAVAAIGLLMLSGRLELRRGITVVIGCFILFGAAGIGAVLTGMAGGNNQSSSSVAPGSGPLSNQLRPSAQTPSAYDPYAGASVPAAR